MRSLESSLLMLMMTTASCVGPEANAQGKVPVRVIFDTDISADVDDVGATAVLHYLADAGEAEIVAMGVSSTFPWSPICLNALNTFFGRPDIPIGMVRMEGPLAETLGTPSNYAEGIAQKFPHKLVSAKDCPPAAELYRKVLAQSPDQSVVFITVGFLTNLSALLKTDPDSYSDLSGVDLVRKKAKHWVCMGATFPKGREFNIFMDTQASIHAVSEWPTPITFSGFEIGARILTGAGLSSLPEDDPVREAYRLYHQGRVQDRQSWDQTAVLYAVRGLGGGLKEFWDVGSGGSLTVLENGDDAWQTTPKKSQAYLIEKKSPEDVAKAIESMMKERKR